MAVESYNRETSVTTHDNRLTLSPFFGFWQIFEDLSRGSGCLRRETNGWTMASDRSSSSSAENLSDSSPPSSVEDVPVKLPLPFFPPSLSKREKEDVESNNAARLVHKTHKTLPQVPIEEQVIEINEDDK